MPINLMRLTAFDMKKIFAATAVVAVIIAGYFGYQRHSDTEFLNTLTPHIKNASIRVTNSSELEVKPSQATFKEVFERLDTDIAEIEKHLIEVQSISSSKTTQISTPAIAYLRAAQEFSRALSMKYRKTLIASTSHESYIDALKDQIAASGYGREHAQARSDRASDAATKATEELAVATSDLQTAATTLKTARNTASPLFPDDALVTTKRLDEVIAANAESKKPETAKK
jgi:hypothetical protein